MAWSETRASEAKAFFHSPVGRELLIELADSRPKISGTTIESKALSGSVVEGYELAQEKIGTLLNFKDEQTTSPTEWLTTMRD